MVFNRLWLHLMLWNICENNSFLLSFIQLSGNYKQYLSFILCFEVNTKKWTMSCQYITRKPEITNSGTLSHGRKFTDHSKALTPETSSMKCKIKSSNSLINNYTFSFVTAQCFKSMFISLRLCRTSTIQCEWSVTLKIIMYSNENNNINLWFMLYLELWSEPYFYRKLIHKFWFKNSAVQEYKMW